MIELTKLEIKSLKTIAKIYGVKIFFKKGFNGGAFCPNYIIVDSTSYTLNNIISTFFHELAHYVNFKTNKYPLYHKIHNINKLRKIIPEYNRFIRYCLNAELYTEKVGKKLMKEWFPTLKYKTIYKNNKESYEFLNGYYLRN